VQRDFSSYVFFCKEGHGTYNDSLQAAARDIIRVRKVLKKTRGYQLKT